MQRTALLSKKQSGDNNAKREVIGFTGKSISHDWEKKIHMSVGQVRWTQDADGKQERAYE
jgi:hypothetical protein